MEQIVPKQSSNDAIGIESPTPTTARILQRLGYLKENYPVKIFEFLGM